MRSLNPLITITLSAILFFQTATAPAHKLKGDPLAIDLLLQHGDQDAWQNGSFIQTQLSGEGESAAIMLKKSSNGEFHFNGYYESRPMEAGFLFHEVLPSWNLSLPANTGYAVQLTVKRNKGGWSSWYYIVGDNAVWDPSFEKSKDDDLGTVDVDYWMGVPVKFVKYRVWLFSRDGNSSPKLKRFFLALRGSRKNNPNFSAPERAASSLPQKFNISVPFRYQSEVSNRRLWGLICCPTSAAMVLGAFGRDVGTTRSAEMCYDPEVRIYGIWPRASQTISHFNLTSYVRRFRNLDEARLQLTKGSPIMASIKADEGELPEAIYSSIGGHLIVITGYEGSDWFIVNDPASRRREKCFQVKYSASGLQKCWINRGGVGIVTFPERHRIDTRMNIPLHVQETIRKSP